LAADSVDEVHEHRAGAVLGDGRDLDVRSQGHGVVSAKVCTQQPFQFGLVEQVRLGVAVPSPADVAPELGEYSHRTVDQSQPMAWPGDRVELLGKPDKAEDPVDLVVEMYRPRLRVDRRPALEDQALDAVPAEQACRGQPGRAGTDDDHGDRPRVHRDAPYSAAR
jgi:hypothetical protein